MNEKCREKLRLEAEKQALILIRKNWPQIIEDYETALEEHNEDNSEKKFNYGVSMGLNIIGNDPEAYEILGKISSTVKHVGRTSGKVRIKEDLVDEMNKAAAAEQQAEDSGDTSEATPAADPPKPPKKSTPRTASKKPIAPKTEAEAKAQAKGNQPAQ